MDKSLFGFVGFAASVDVVPDDGGICVVVKLQSTPCGQLLPSNCSSLDGSAVTILLGFADGIGPKT